MNTSYQMQTVQSTVPIIQEAETLPASRSLAEVTYALAENAAFVDRLKAALTKQALDNTAALASVEAYYNQIAPSGREDYRFIIQSYARIAMMQIAGGDW